MPCYAKTTGLEREFMLRPDSCAVLLKSRYGRSRKRIAAECLRRPTTKIITADIASASGQRESAGRFTIRTPGAQRWPQSILCDRLRKAMVSTPVSWKENRARIDIQDFRSTTCASGFRESRDLLQRTLLSEHETIQFCSRIEVTCSAICNLRPGSSRR